MSKPLDHEEVLALEKRLQSALAERSALQAKAQGCEATLGAKLVEGDLLAMAWAQDDLEQAQKDYNEADKKCEEAQKALVGFKRQ
jgi:hypothetical protein